jgi:pyruvate formate lyase activating enzyme
VLRTTGTLFDIKRFAIHDGPGIRTTVFFKGCPLACRWCHNPESQRPERELLFWAERCRGCGRCVSACPAGAVTIADGIATTDRERCTACGECVAACPEEARAIAGKLWAVEDVLDVIEKDVLFYDQSGGGVTLSGGEPLAQPEFAAALLSECRQRRIHTAVDTCAYAKQDVLATIAELTDLFLFDVKHLDDASHLALTGVSNGKILENLHWLDERGDRIWVRYPLIPGLNDTPDDLAALARLVDRLESVDAVHVLPFHRGGESKRERLGRASSSVDPSENPGEAADRAAARLRDMLCVPVRTGG